MTYRRTLSLKGAEIHYSDSPHVARRDEATFPSASLDRLVPGVFVAGIHDRPRVWSCSCRVGHWRVGFPCCSPSLADFLVGIRAQPASSTRRLGRASSRLFTASRGAFRRSRRALSGALSIPVLR